MPNREPKGQNLETFTVSSFLVVLVSNCPGGGFGDPGGGGPGGFFSTGRTVAVVACHYFYLF